MTFELLAIVFFSCGSMLGFLVTALLPHKLSVWWLWPGVRVAWQLGGGLWCGQAVGSLMGGGSAAIWSLLGFGALGAVLCATAIADLVRGPVCWEGEVVAQEVQRGHLWVPMLVPHNPTIHGQVGIRTGEGQVHTLRTAGLQTYLLTKQLNGVAGAARVRLRALRFVGAPLSVERL
jgi:hypothetical protein